LLVALGLTLGLAVTTKFSVALVPLLFCVVAARQGWPLRALLRRVTVVALAALAVAGWWFLFLIWHFNEIETKGVVAGVVSAIVPQVATNVSGEELLAGQTARSHALDFAAWLAYFGQSFWAASFSPNREAFALSPYVFWGVALLLIPSTVGLARYWRRSDGFRRQWLGFLALHILSFVPLMQLRYLLNGRIYETAQGRHTLMPAGAAIAILLAAGWLEITTPRPTRWLRPLLPGLLCFWSLAQLYVIYDTYPAPLPVSVQPGSPPQVETPVGRMAFDSFELTGYTLRSGPATLEVTLAWLSHHPAAKDYLTELRLVGPAGQTASSWIRHAGDGLYPTRVWAAGELIYDRAELPLYRLEPGAYTLELYLIDADVATGPPPTNPFLAVPVELHPEGGPPQAEYQRWPASFFDLRRPRYQYRAAIPILRPAHQPAGLKLVAPNGREFAPLDRAGNLQTFIVAADWPAGIYRLEVEGVPSTPLLEVINRERQFTLPTTLRPLEANFYDYVRLAGYDLPDRWVQPGEELPVFVYWQSLQTLGANLIMFNHLYDADNRQWASFDHILPPYYGGTLLWAPGEVVSDGYTIPIPPGTPAGVYYLRVGLFLPQGEDAWTPVPVMHAGQPTAVTYVTLGPIQVGPPPTQIVVASPAPQYPRHDNLGDVVELIGYDASPSPSATGASASPLATLELTLYWQSRRVTATDYTLFVHLRDEAGQIIAQQDGPAGDGYPTSLWEAGTIIRDPVRLSLPPDLPAGTYEVQVGFYNLATGERLPVVGADEDVIFLFTFDLDADEH
jgi:hypothetical protein